MRVDHYYACPCIIVCLYYCCFRCNFRSPNSCKWGCQPLIAMERTFRITSSLALHELLVLVMVNVRWLQTLLVMALPLMSLIYRNLQLRGSVLAEFCKKPSLVISVSPSRGGEHLIWFIVLLYWYATNAIERSSHTLTFELTLTFQLTLKFELALKFELTFDLRCCIVYLLWLLQIKAMTKPPIQIDVSLVIQDNTC